MIEEKTISENLHNVVAVFKYLKAHAWQISRSQLYEHVDCKKLNRGDDGTFSISAVDKYATKHLRCADGSRPSKALADIQTRKYDAELRQSVANAEMKELKISILKGEYVRKDAFELALTLRARLFKHDIEAFCRTKAADIINLVGVNNDKIPDLIDYLLEETANWLNCYAEDREFAVPEPFNEDNLILNDEEDEDNAQKYQS